MGGKGSKAASQGRATSRSSSTGSSDLTATPVVVSAPTVYSPSTTNTAAPLTRKPSTSGDSKAAREGPPEALLEKCPGTTRDYFTFFTPLDVRNRGGDFETLRGNVRVRSGKWYYEVTIQTTGSIYVGWCTKDFKAVSMSASLGSDEHSWAFDGTRHPSVALHQGNDIAYGKNWGAGKTVGVALDCQKGEIEFFIDGDSQGIAFSGVNVERGMHPAITLDGSQRVLVNFGATSFKFPRTGYMGLHSNLTSDGIAKLEKLFEKYKAAGVEAGDNADIDAVQPSGVDAMCKDLNIDPEGIEFLALQWRIGNKTPFEITRAEWIAGFDQLQCSDVSSLKKCVSKLRDDLKDPKNFKRFYMFVFDYMKEKPTARVIAVDTALTAWGVVLAGRFPLLNEWCTYVEENHKAPIRKDTWEMLLKFATVVGADLNKYNDSEAWPVIFDEFVEKMKAK